MDFSRNPHAPEFGRYGVVHVRYGKAKKGSPHKRRSALTVFDWTPDVLADWLAHGQSHLDAGIDLFPSEKGALVAENTLLRRFRRYCDDLELSAGLDLHSLRRSYATHLIEDGWDPKFVQDQLGHDHASTTSLYTCVSSDYRVRTLRRVLDATIKNALGFGGEETS
jgi:integrase/recombinase XerD